MTRKTRVRKHKRRKPNGGYTEVREHNREIEDRKENMEKIEQDIHQDLYNNSKKLKQAKEYLKDQKRKAEKGLIEDWQYKRAKYIYEYITEEEPEIEIYRIIYTDKPRELLKKKENIGHFWSYEPNQLESPWGKKKGKATLLVTAIANKNDINLIESMREAQYGENEIILKGNIKIINAYIQDEQLSGKEANIDFEPYQIHVDTDIGYKIK